MKKVIKKDYNQMSVACAQAIAEFINQHPGGLMCFAAGDTPLAALKHLLELQAEGRVDLTSVCYVGLDEWMGLDYHDKGSCLQIMTDCFYAPAGIPAENIVVFDGKGDAEAETKKVLGFIKEKGGISLTMLGIGMNGHVGFNEPGTPMDFAGGVVTLSQTSRTVGQKYFDREYPPEKGVTIGIKTLLEAQKVFLVANGEKKAEILQRALKNGIDPDVPASLLAEHPDYTVFLDEGAAKLL